MRPFRSRPVSSSRRRWKTSGGPSSSRAARVRGTGRSPRGRSAPGRTGRAARGPRLGAARVRAEAIVPDPGPPDPCATGRGMAVRARRLGPVSVLSARLPHRADLAPPRPRGPQRGHRDGGARVRRRDSLAFAPRDRVAARGAAPVGPDRVPDPADGARQPDLAAATRLASRRLGSRDAAGARPTEDRHVASTRLIPVALRAAPGVTLALLVGWATLDVYAIGEPRWSAALFTVLSIGVVAVTLSVVLHWRGIRAIGLIAIGGGYVGAHALVLGVQLVPALVFLSLLISQVELRILGERFAPLYEAGLGPDERTRIHGALGRAVLRLIISAVLSVVVPILAADLAVAGIVPATTIPTAIALAGALVAVVALLALMPSLSRRAT